LGENFLTMIIDGIENTGKYFFLGIRFEKTLSFLKKKNQSQLRNW